MKSSWWIALTKTCQTSDTCVISGNVIEVIHAAIQMILSVSIEIIDLIYIRSMIKIDSKVNQVQDLILLA